MSRVLKPDEVEELHDWLELYGIPTTQVGRHFSDGVEFAKLLKKLYPKLLHLKSYPPCTSLLLKVSNWSSLNSKALAKLKIFQTKSKLEAFANGKTEAIEVLLHKLMTLQKDAEQTAEKQQVSVKTEQEEMWEANGEIMTIKLQKTIDGNVIEMKRKLILFNIYENVMKDVQLQREALAEAEQKISNYTQQLALREERIAELRKKLDIETSKTLL